MTSISIDTAALTMFDTSRVLDKPEREATLSYKKGGAANGFKETGPAGASRWCAAGWEPQGARRKAHPLLGTTRVPP